jgi:hypothetical protein
LVVVCESGIEGAAGSCESASTIRAVIVGLIW